MDDISKFTDLKSPSHPSRVRGLKSTISLSNIKMNTVVAPFTGAWIEIRYADSRDEEIMLSHPSRVRGLK